MIPPSPPPQNSELRVAAEDSLTRSPQLDGYLQSSEKLLHELHVHQVELEMQNEALRQTKNALEESRARYIDLYEFAPVGYLTLSLDGFISEINLAGSGLLGLDRRNLLQRSFAAFVCEEDQRHWGLHFNNVAEDDWQSSIELALQRGDGIRIYARLDCTRPSRNPTPGAQEIWTANQSLDSGKGRAKHLGMLVTLTDISKRNQAENELRESESQLRQLSNFLQQVREEDRSYFARELHDELGQNLTALRFDFDLLADDLASEKPEVVSRLEAINQIIHGTVDAVRRICEDLRPGMLDDLGLAAALVSHVKRFARQSGVSCDLELDRQDYAINEQISTAIFRIVQESLTNIARHAGAAHAMVSLQDDGDELVLMVADDGCGIPAKPTGGKNNFGLIGIRERVNMLGGRLTIDSEPGRGTHIEIHIPKPPEVAQ
ncbi:MAG: ATP-binding protein [Betaproteobacteria bacterium]